MNSNYKQPMFENVLGREFAAEEPNQAYVTDITYIWTQEGWLYLAMFIDLFCRRLLGWSMDSWMKARLVTDALRAHYASKTYRHLLKASDFIGSMSRTAVIAGTMRSRRFSSQA